MPSVEEGDFSNDEDSDDGDDYDQDEVVLGSGIRQIRNSDQIKEAVSEKVFLVYLNFFIRSGPNTYSELYH